MITKYKETGIVARLSDYKVLSPGAKKTSDIASITLEERSRVTRPQLMVLFEEQGAFKGYSSNSYSSLWTNTSRSMQEHGLVEIVYEPVERYLTEGELSDRQIFNCMSGLIDSGVIEPRMMGFYSPKEEFFWDKIKEYKRSGVSISDAMKTSVLEVFGEQKSLLFET
jgi:hypothetical protein